MDVIKNLLGAKSKSELCIDLLQWYLNSEHFRFWFSERRLATAGWRTVNVDYEFFFKTTIQSQEKAEVVPGFKFFVTKKLFISWDAPIHFLVRSNIWRKVVLIFFESWLGSKAYENKKNIFGCVLVSLRQ